MILTGHQPNYLPYPGFFEKVMRADLFLLVDTVQFVKRGPFGWIHRNRILGPAPTGWSWLTVPVLTHDRYHQSIHEARIDNRLPWRRKHWRTIEERYRHSPGFPDYAPALSAIYERSWDSLGELNEALIREFLGFLDIRTPVKRLSDLSSGGKATELIINFCRELGADQYLSGVHGKDYLDRAAFEEAGIRLTFQEFRCPAYPQPGGGPFVPNLSALDLLLSVGGGARGLIEAGAPEDLPCSR
jgi:WbqC-like protein